MLLMRLIDVDASLAMFQSGGYPDPSKVPFGSLVLVIQAFQLLDNPQRGP